MVRTLKKESHVTLSEAKQHFITDCKIRNLSKLTIEWYERNLRIALPWNKKYINEITTDDIKEVIAKLQNEGRSSNTINGKIRSLKAFYNYLHRDGLIKENIMENIKPLKSQQKLIKTFSDQQVKALLQQPNKKTFSGLRDYTLMLLLLDTGMRISEALNLKIKDLNLENNSILISKTKNKKERVVPIGSILRKALADYMKHVSDLGPDDYLFITVHDNQMDRNRVRERIAKYGEKAGITNVRCSPHTFRHTFAVNYLRNGGNIYYLQSILGHSSLEMVKRYLQVIDDDVLAAHSRFSPLDNIKKRRK